MGGDSLSEKTSAESREGGDSWAPAPEVSGSNAGARAGGNVINGPESEAKRHRLKPEPESQGGVTIAGGNEITVKSHQLTTAEATWVSLRVGKMRFLLSCQFI